MLNETFSVIFKHRVHIGIRKVRAKRGTIFLYPSLNNFWWFIEYLNQKWDFGVKIQI